MVASPEEMHSTDATAAAQNGPVELTEFVAVDAAGTPPSGPRRWLYVLIGVLAAGLVTMLLLCGGLMYLFTPSVQTEPAEVLAAAQKVVPFQLPPGFVGVRSVRIDNWLLTFQNSRFEHESGRGVLLVAGYQLKMAVDPKDAERAMKPLIEDASSEIRVLGKPDRTPVNLSIGGNNVVFDVLEGEDLQSTTRFRQAIGSFEGSTGPSRVWLQAESDVLSGAELEAFLHSLGQKTP